MTTWRIGLMVLMGLSLSVGVFADSDPEVTHVTATPRPDGSGIVDISYTLDCPEDSTRVISVLVSDDGGITWNITPSWASLSGDFGDGIMPGIRQIVWDSKPDLPWRFGSNYRVKVTANDSHMIWVYINDPGVSNHVPFNGYMSKYETTNAQFAQYLNAAKASGDIVIDGNSVKGAIGSNSGTDFAGQNYYNLAGSGYSYNGATNGGAARINWTGSTFTVDAGFENHPVTYVSWYGATAFASYYGWRLPTEWEWQAVADYNGTYTYGCGTTINNSIANYSNSVHPHGTTRVGQFGTYGYGMADMAGNAWEWTNSIFSGSDRVIRGGSWFNDGSYCAVSDRYYFSPFGMHGGIGFRVCR